MIFVYYIFALLLVYFSFRSFRGGIAYLEYFRKSLNGRRSNVHPFATVIAPCKGIDEGLDANLSALLDQEYPAYEVIFAVDDKDDPAVSVITDLTTEAAENTDSRAPQTRLVVAAKAADSGQKVENLREAVLHADSRSEVFVFVDSDARPGREWLSVLTGALDDKKIGAATGYRWFLSKRPTFGSELRSAWNASIASALGPNRRSNFCWGGSMAIRREVFDRLDIREKWKGTVSDDFIVTRILKDAGMDIVFVPLALTASIESCSFRECLEFTTRQMKITRAYARDLWLISFFGSALFTLVMTASFLIVIFSRANSIPVITALVVIGLVSLLSIGKAWLRLKAVGLVLTGAEADVKRQTFEQLTLWALSQPLFLYNSVCALFSRTIVWRGVSYRLVSGKRTVREK